MTLINCVPDDIGNVGHPLIHIAVDINDGGKDDLVFNLLCSTKESLC